MIALRIVGQGTLAHAVRVCSAPHHWNADHLATPPDLLWVCYDTPLSAEDVPDVAWLRQQIRVDLAAVAADCPVLVSSPVPLGTMAALELEAPSHVWACAPENVRVASALTDFAQQTRIVVGCRTEVLDGFWRELFRPFTSRVILTSPETAELAKLALNSYLGLSIAYSNEIARIAATTGADMALVTQALVTDRRVSPDAPLHAGAPFAGGHLARDIRGLTGWSATHQLTTPLLDQILASNRA